MAITSNNKKGQDGKKYKVINLNMSMKDMGEMRNGQSYLNYPKKNYMGCIPMKCGGTVLFFCSPLNRGKQ